MKRFSKPAVVAALSVATLLSCVDGDSPVTPPVTYFAVAVVPRFAAELVPPAAAATINRVRISAYAATTPPTLLTTFVTDVDPDAEQWEFTVEIPVPAGGESVFLTVELINVAGGVETVEYSGTTPPFGLQGGGQGTSIRTVDVTRGPLSNQSVTSVVVSPDSAVIAEGDSVLLSASVTTTGTTAPTVYWTSLDPQATVASTGMVRGLLPGVARIVAQAGAPADTARVRVLAVPEAVTVTPDTIFAESLGTEVAFQARVVDARGAAVPGETVTWRTPDPGLLAHVGGGVFRTLGVGVATVEAVAVSDTTLKGRGTVVTALAAVDVAVAKAADRSAAVVDDTVTFTITAKNEGARTAEGVAVLESLPANVELLGAVADRGAYDAGAARWTVGSLALGAEARLTLRVRATAAGTATNTATLDADAVPADGIAGNNTASASVAVTDRLADLSVGKTVNVGSAFEGDELIYTVTVRNDGPLAAGDVVVSDDLPAALELLGSTTTQGAFASGRWAVGALGAGASATLTLRTRVVAGVRDRDVVNAAVLDGFTGASDPDSDDHRAAVSVSIGVKTADLSVSKSADKASAHVGDTVTYTIEVRNHGPYTVDSVRVVDPLPAELDVLSHTVTRGSVADSVWTIGALALGESVTGTVRGVVKASAEGRTVVNRARIDRFTGVVDRTEEDHDASASVAVVARGADLSVAGTVSPAKANVGAGVLFDVTLANAGPGTATAIRAQGSMGTGLHLDSVRPTRGTVDPATATWTLDTLRVGASEHLKIYGTVEKDAPAAVAAGARILASAPADPNPLNDSTAASLAVNHAPTADAGAASTSDTAAVAIPLSAADVDGDSLVFSIVTGPEAGTLGPFTNLVRTGATVTYTPVPNTGGVVHFTYEVDDGMAADTAMVTVTVTEVPKSRSYSVPGNTELFAGPAGSRPGTPHVYRAQALLPSATTLQVTDLGCGGLTCADALGERTALADGTLTFRPATGVTDTTAAYSYQTNNGHVATLTLAITADRVWYVDGAWPGAESGRSWEPYNTLAEVEGGGPSAVEGANGPSAVASGVSGAGDILYVGDGTYGTGIALLSGQTLTGEAADLVVGGEKLAGAGARPVLGGPVTLATGATVAGLTVSGSAGDGIAGTSSSVTLRNVIVQNAAGDGIELSAGAGGAVLDSVTVSGAAGRGLALTGVAGTVTATNMSVSTAAGTGIEVQKGAPTLTYTGTAVASSGAFTLLQVDSTTAGANISFLGGPYTAVADTAARFRHASGSVRVDGLEINPGTGIGVSIVTADTATVPGSFDFNELDIDDVTYHAVTIEGGRPTVDIALAAASLDHTSSSTAVSVSGTDGAAVTFSGGPIEVVSAGPGIRLYDNPGSTLTFHNQLVLNTQTGVAFEATAGGTVVVDGADNTIVTTTGKAVYLDGAAIGAGGMRFRSVSSDGAPNGIYMVDAGSGPFSITGTGTTPGSGGTIANSTSEGMHFASGNPLEIRNLNIEGSAGDGLHAEGITGLTVDNGVFSLNQVGSCEGDCGAGIYLKNATGTLAVTNSLMDQNGQAGIQLVQDLGAPTLDVTGTTLSRSANGPGLALSVGSGADVGVKLTGSTVEGNGSAGLYAYVHDNGILDLVVGGAGALTNVFDGNGSGGIHLYGSGGTTTSVEFDVDGNTFDGNAGEAVMVVGYPSSTGGPAFEGTIRNNTARNSVNAEHNTFFLDVDDGAAVVQISNNTLGSATTPLASGEVGVYAGFGSGYGGAGDSHLTILDNVIHQGSDLHGVAIFPYSPKTVCVDVRNNDVRGTWSAGKPYSLVAGGAFSIERLTGSAASDASAHVASENKVNGAAAASGDVYASGTFTPVAGGACTKPSK